jgi:hypothetical protein
MMETDDEFGVFEVITTFATMLLPLCCFRPFLTTCISIISIGYLVVPTLTQNTSSVYDCGVCAILHRDILRKN